MLFKSVLLSLCVVATLGQNDPNCGTKGPTRVAPRIVGGQNTAPLEFPWQISLRTTNGAQWYHTCGGSIINDKWILTAAHCVDRTPDATKYIVLAGEHDRSKTEGTEVYANVAKVIKHPSYNSQTIDWDVAVLKLASKLDLSGRLGSVCIPEKGSSVEGQQCVATGWGNTKWQGTSPNILQKVTVPVVAQTTCASRYQGVNTVTARMICSGQGGKGTCQGDSGGKGVTSGINYNATNKPNILGPLNCKIGNKWFTYGATSWAVKCAEAQYPSVSARVSEFADWIWTQIKQNS